MMRTFAGIFHQSDAYMLVSLVLVMSMKRMCSVDGWLSMVMVMNRMCLGTFHRSFMCVDGVGDVDEEDVRCVSQWGW